MYNMSDIFKDGSTIKENCRCRTSINGTIQNGIASFYCPVCHNQWSYRVVGKGRGSNFSSADLNRILKTRNVTIGR